VLGLCPLFNTAIRPWALVNGAYALAHDIMLNGGASCFVLIGVDANTFAKCIVLRGRGDIDEIIISNCSKGNNAWG